LCIVDARSHRPVELAPGRRTPLRVWVHVPCNGACDELSGLRVLLVADVLARTAELFGGQALVGIASSAAYGDRREAFERHAADLGIRPIEEDLDVPAVLGVLRWLEGESELPDGSKFETFAHLDRVLGLELTRDVGSAYPYGPAR
jgi:hypothetical protein